MEINWTTFTAQIINFLVLTWLLKRFLYGPIVRAMDEREKRLAERQDEATAAKQSAAQEAAEYRRRNEDLDHAREELLAEAGREIEDWKQQHLQQARGEVDHVRKEWYRSIERERGAFLRDLRQRAGQQVHQMTRRVMGKLCRATLEGEVVEAFAERLQQVDENKRSEIAAAIRNSQHRVLVETAFELPDERRRRIEAMIHEHLTDGIDIEFKVVPELICGIELKAAGYKVAWSVGETLEELEDEFATALDAAVSQ
jgi:F-type H+-transporting ATPase subunit b